MATPSKHPKQALQEYTQKRYLGLPKYSHEVLKPGEQRQGDVWKYSVKSFVTVGDQKFESEGFFINKKEADCNVAVLALNLLASGSLPDSSQQKGMVLPDQSTAAYSQNPSMVECVRLSSENPKTRLSNLCQKRNLLHPTYQCKSVALGSGFMCAATFNGTEFKSDEIFPRKKLAEIRAASLILKSLEDDETEQTKSDPKTLLVNRASKMKVMYPVYNCRKVDKSKYKCTATFIGKDFDSDEAFPTKKLAESQVAGLILDYLDSNAPSINMAVQEPNLIERPFETENSEQSGNAGFLGNTVSPQTSPVLHVSSRFGTSSLPHLVPPMAGQGNMSPGYRVMSSLPPPMVSPQLRTPGMPPCDDSFVQSPQMIGSCLRTPELPPPGSFVTPPQITSRQSQGFEVHVPPHAHSVGLSPEMLSPRSRTSDISMPPPGFHGTPSRNTWESSSQMTDQFLRTPQLSPPIDSDTQSAPKVINLGLSHPNFSMSLTPSSELLPTESLTPQCVFLEMSYKNFLQEYLQQRGMKTAKYETRIKGCGFTSSVKFCDRTVSCEGVFTTKKMAEQMAARRGLVAIGMKKPEELFENRKGKNNKLKTLQPGMRMTWLHQHDPGTPYSSSATKRQGEDFDDGESPLKRGRLDWEGDMPPECRKNLSVGEIWQEKSVAIVGDENCSFILLSSQWSKSLQLFCTKTKSLEILKPGHCLVGLDMRCIKYQGKIALEATQCTDIFLPDPPNPVLISCGVAILYHDKEASTDIQILLKRYLCSGAFVNVAAELARYLRCLASDRPSLLNIDKMITNIKAWMTQEVEWIAMMNEEALRRVFSRMWKFSNKWSEFLHPDTLPFELQKLQAVAKDELARRKVTSKKFSEEHYRPWGLPKGNFGHKALSTGLYIESPVECAARELREETGIQLEPYKLNDAPYVDIPQTENFNPHRGDVMRFYLYVYKPDPFTEFSETLDTSHQSDCSIQSDEGGNFLAVEGGDIVVLGSGENRVAAVLTNAGSELEARSDTNSSNEESSAVEKSQDNNADNGRVKTPESEGGVDTRRGQKRKRDSESDQDSEAPQQKRVLGLTSTHESSARITTSTPLTNTRQSICSTTPSSVRSPRVQGGVHEECAWFTVDEARRKSPLFDQIYNTSQFAEVLTSVCVEKS